MTLTFRPARLTGILATVAVMGAGCGSRESGTQGSGGATGGATANGCGSARRVLRRRPSRAAGTPSAQ